MRWGDGMIMRISEASVIIFEGQLLETKVEHCRFVI